ncbi:MAG: DUF4281 domain-containing protein [Sphingomonadales bacterium]|jgi:hypothetical protein|nr:DUF4281 domain-containing protein [Sphingomonadales bacterium]MBK9267494.1 DUF4281 domain-containing protein [Sphingomonadales bacterium]MBP6433221.1 DUF4281 domain-containing protein [Sphingorhabdus sp.]
MQLPWEAIFEATNIYAMICWLVLLFAPRREQVLPLLFMAGCGLLALTYAVLIVGLMSGTLDPDGPRSQDFSSLAGVMGFFDSKGGATVGWIHYLAFDLFVGIWAARNADRRGISRWMQIPVLPFIFLLGPLGLVLYLALRAFTGKSVENAVAPS